MLIGRRGVLLAGGALAGGALAEAGPAAAAADSALPVPPGNAMAFRLVRHDSDIGRHTLAFTRQGGDLTVRINVDVLVTLISIPLVRYAHQATETWRDGQLVALSGDTDKNGRKEWLRATSTAEGLAVTGSRTARYIAPTGAIGTSYWNKRMLDGPMISMEDGVLLRPKIAPLPAQPVKLASGSTIEANRYDLTGDFSADVWYDRTNTWASLAFSVPDGSIVHYERL
jgi:hypothetical protein